MVRKVTLEELKKITKEHMIKELDIMEMIFSLDDKKDIEEFSKWYINLPQCRCIQEVKQIVRRKTDGEDQGNGISIVRPEREKKCD